MRHRLRASLIAATALAAVLVTGTTATAAVAGHSAPENHSNPVKPTIVLVHGAFADSSSWSSEIAALQQRGYPVVAVANPLRGVAVDTAYLSSVLATIQGPIVLVGHSYAGFLIGPAAAAEPSVKALVYVAAYIPVPGESPADLTYKDPGSLLTGDNLVARPFAGGTDLYVNPSTFGKVYAGGLSPAAVANAAVVQRPITAAALGEPATVAPPAGVPKWEIVALEDHAIPTVTQKFMAARAGATVVPTHSGHDVPAAQPAVVTNVILDAARSLH